MYSSSLGDECSPTESLTSKTIYNNDGGKYNYEEFTA